MSAYITFQLLDSCATQSLAALKANPAQYQAMLAQAGSENALLQAIVSECLKQLGASITGAQLVACASEMRAALEADPARLAEEIENAGGDAQLAQLIVSTCLDKLQQTSVVPGTPAKPVEKKYPWGWVLGGLAVVGVGIVGYSAMKDGKKKSKKSSRKPNPTSCKCRRARSSR